MGGTIPTGSTGQSLAFSLNECPIFQPSIVAIQTGGKSRVSLTIDERDDLAGGSTDLTQGTSGVGDGRTSGGRDLGETLRSLGSS